LLEAEAPEAEAPEAEALRVEAEVLTILALPHHCLKDIRTSGQMVYLSSFSCFNLILKPRFNESELFGPL
jgi:hypothetical protein